MAAVLDMLKGWLGNSFAGSAQVPRQPSLGNNPQLGRQNAQGGEVILTSGSDLDVYARGGAGLQGNADVTGVTPSKYRRPKRKAGDSLPANANTFNQSANGEPWPTLLAGGFKMFTAFRPNGLKTIEAHNTPANFAWETSRANYGFRGKWMDSAKGIAPDIAGYPGPAPSAQAPEYNVLAPIVYGLRVLDLKQQANPSDLIQVPVVQVAPSTYTPPGSASLKETLL